MRLAVDTNTALSGLLWPGGPPGALIDLAEAGHIELLSSPALMAELRDVLGRRKFIKRLASRDIGADDLFNGYASLIRLVKPTATPRVIKRDPDDDHVIACAVTGRAEIIVSGDQDVLELISYQTIAILTPAQAIACIQGGKE